MKKSQTAWVKEQLREKGYVTRNECLRSYISRLGAIICTLKAEGYTFDTFRKEGDYGYRHTNPNKKTEFRVVERDGKMVAIAV